MLKMLYTQEMATTTTDIALGWSFREGAAAEVAAGEAVLGAVVADEVTGDLQLDAASTECW